MYTETQGAKSPRETRAFWSHCTKKSQNKKHHPTKKPHNNRFTAGAEHWVKSYSCSGDYSSAIISHKGIYPLSSGLNRAAISCRQEGKEPHSIREQKLTYQSSGTSHRNLLSQSTTVAKPFAGSSPITLRPARSRPENSMPSMHCCKAQLPGGMQTSFTTEISLLKSLGQEFTTAVVPDSWNPRDRKRAVICLLCTQITSHHSYFLALKNSLQK